jgi:hypothetical protein
VQYLDFPTATSKGLFKTAQAPQRESRSRETGGGFESPDEAGAGLALPLRGRKYL